MQWCTGMNVVGEEEHRQAIFISGRGHEEGKLLAVLPVKDGTGLTQARATARAIEDWSCASNVKALCFDTTSSNTGRVQGCPSGGAAGKTAVEAWVQTPRHGTGGESLCQQHLRQNIGPYGPSLPDS
ncbi:uncharacterized protein LOC121873066 [Homarus americanus]|uniref:uncharacterized protein LOC121873066 n=1 Tax=Homarus americanus TaxID=6706 RepID=UPI001C488504|nr:uncharacterized protein LOC121873066 [Homarus americanus]